MLCCDEKSPCQALDVVSTEDDKIHILPLIAMTGVSQDAAVNGSKPACRTRLRNMRALSKKRIVIFFPIPDKSINQVAGGDGQRRASSHLIILFSLSVFIGVNQSLFESSFPTIMVSTKLYRGKVSWGRRLQAGSRSGWKESRAGRASVPASRRRTAA